ncbi:DMT family transporter [soil metagenome]
MGAGEWGLLALLSLLWGGSFFFAEVALAELSPLTVVLARVALAAAALNLVVRATGRRMPVAPSIWGAFFAMGTLNNLIPFSLIVWGQTQIASGLAAILNATTPLFAVVLAHILTRDERMTANRLAGVLVGFVGVVLLIGPAVLGGAAGAAVLGCAAGAAVLAQGAVLAAALSYAFAGIYGRRFRGMGLSPLQTATGQVSASAVMMIPLVIVVDRPWALAPPGGTTVAALVALALLSTAAAYVIYFRLLARAGATNLLLVTLLIPVSAILLGTLILGERFEARHFGGMAMIGIGLACIDGRPLRSLARGLRRAARRLARA